MVSLWRAASFIPRVFLLPLRMIGAIFRLCKFAMSVASRFARLPFFVAKEAVRGIFEAGGRWCVNRQANQSGCSPCYTARSTTSHSGASSPYFSCASQPVFGFQSDDAVTDRDTLSPITANSSCGSAPVPSCSGCGSLWFDSWCDHEAERLTDVIQNGTDEQFLAVQREVTEYERIILSMSTQMDAKERAMLIASCKDAQNDASASDLHSDKDRTIGQLDGSDGEGTLRRRSTVGPYVLFSRVSPLCTSSPLQANATDLSAPPINVKPIPFDVDGDFNGADLSSNFTDIESSILAGAIDQEMSTIAHETTASEDSSNLTDRHFTDIRSHVELNDTDHNRNLTPRRVVDLPVVFCDDAVPHL